MKNSNLHWPRYALGNFIKKIPVNPSSRLFILDWQRTLINLLFGITLVGNRTSYCWITALTFLSLLSIPLHSIPLHSIPIHSLSLSLSLSHWVVLGQLMLLQYIPTWETFPQSYILYLAMLVAWPESSRDSELSSDSNPIAIFCACELKLFSPKLMRWSDRCLFDISGYHCNKSIVQGHYVQ